MYCHLSIRLVNLDPEDDAGSRVTICVRRCRRHFQELGPRQVTGNDGIISPPRTASTRTGSTTSHHESESHTLVESTIDTAQKHSHEPASPRPESTSWSSSASNHDLPSKSFVVPASTRQAIAAIYRKALPHGFNYSDVAQARGLDEEAYDADDEDGGGDGREDGGGGGSSYESDCGREGSQGSVLGEGSEACRESCIQNGRSNFEVDEED